MRELDVPFNLHRFFIDDTTLFNELAEIWWERYGTLFIAAAILYLPAILILQFIWKYLPAVNLKTWRIFHNLAFCIFSTIGAVELAPTMINTLTTSGNFHDSVCNGYYLHRPESFWVVIFVASKLFELIETFYFIVEKHPIPFIHWYHHILTFIFSTHSLYLRDSSVLYYAWMNYAVHSIMYFYYCVVSFSRKKPSWAILITLAQIIQMFIGTAVVSQTFFCESPHE